MRQITCKILDDLKHILGCHNALEKCGKYAHISQISGFQHESAFSEGHISKSMLYRTLESSIVSYLSLLNIKL